ncbi:hypothetical protein SELMODRAFT_419720 [Selaginella moellendorffii]|uniref:Kinetochore protein SPC25 n=1 Tax=Selaginella moellendorffii TaxID=88036 RepID=D8S9U4_SELML|nr:hypothetical protein SELMODRAFT_419720 [Selaginella moellendorffii]
METVRSARSRFEAWERSCEKRMDELQEMSRSVSRGGHEESEQLKQHLREISEQKIHKEKEITARKQQHETLKKMIEQANEKKIYLAKRLELLKERREGCAHVAEESLKDLEERVRRVQQKVNAQKIARKFYNDILGIRADFASGIKITFTKVNAKNPDHEYSCTIRLDKHTNKYAMLDCVPYVKRSVDLLDDLNITNEFFEFLRLMRREFERLAEESDARSVRLKDLHTFQSVHGGHGARFLRSAATLVPAANLWIPARDPGLGFFPGEAMQLKRAYDKIYDKYERDKARRIENAEKLFEEHKLRTAAYSKATESLVETLREENEMLRHLVKESQVEETMVRLKELEKENALYRNQLLMAQARDCHSDRTREDRYRFLQRLFELLSDMQITEVEDDNSAAFVFLHQSTGLKFSLEPVVDPDTARICGGDREVKFTSLALGSLRYIAPEWMRESITFSISQAPVFFRRIQTVTRGRS